MILLTPLNKLLYIDWHGSLKEPLFTSATLTQAVKTETYFFDEYAPGYVGYTLNNICVGTREISPMFTAAMTMAVRARLKDQPEIAAEICTQLIPAAQASKHRKNRLDPRMAGKMMLAKSGLPRDCIDLLSSSNRMYPTAANEISAHATELEGLGRQEEATLIRELVGSPLSARLGIIARRFSFEGSR